MCGLLAIVGSKLSPEALRLQTLTLQRLVRHRGPDGSGIHVIASPGVLLADGAEKAAAAHIPPQLQAWWIAGGEFHRATKHL